MQCQILNIFSDSYYPHPLNMHRRSEVFPSGIALVLNVVHVELILNRGIFPPALFK